MQHDAIHNEISPAGTIENGKTAWLRPSISRIDIKRTLNGVSGSSDGGSPEP